MKPPGADADAGLEVALRIEARGVDLAFRLARGRTLALLGENGAGKSSVLAVLAGLLVPDAGRVVLGGRVLLDVGDAESAESAASAVKPGRPREGRRPASRRRQIVVPAHRRRTTLLAQEPDLFPHLDVLENVAFAPRSAGAGRAEARERARGLLTLVEAGGLERRRPAELSGGQQQRVAIARALAGDPELLLLDEPLAALDAAVVPGLRRTLREVLSDRTTVLVTHDPLDAHTLADEALVLEGGRVADRGAVREVLGRPRTPFAAELAGVRLVAGYASARGLVLGDGRVLGLALDTSAVAREGEALLAAIPPERVRPVGADAVGGVDDVVVGVEQRGPSVRIRGSLLSADLPAEDAAALLPDVGDRIRFRIDEGAARVYPAAPPPHPDPAG